MRVSASHIRSTLTASSCVMNFGWFFSSFVQCVAIFYFFVVVVVVDVDFFSRPSRDFHDRAYLFNTRHNVFRRRRRRKKQRTERQIAVTYTGKETETTLHFTHIIVIVIFSFFSCSPAPPMKNNQN